MEAEEVGEQENDLPPLVRGLVQRAENAQHERGYNPASDDYNLGARQLMAVMQEDKTRIYGEFLRAVDRMKPPQRDDAFSLTTLFNLRDYDISSITQSKPYEKPGGMMCLYMFYARLFQKLRSRVRAEKVSFWDPIDVEEPAIGIAEVLDFIRDFGLQDFCSKHTTHRIWRTVVREEDLERCFKARINLDQFEELIVVLAEHLYHAPKWNLVTRLKRVQRLVEHLGLESAKVVKSTLFDAYRDHHLHKYDELHDFEEVYHRHVLLSLPSTPVIPLPHERRVRFLEDGAVLQCLKKLEWMDPAKQWEQFRAPFIDMGVMGLGASREFRIDVVNMRYHMLELSFSTEGLDPIVELSYHRRPITAGGRAEIILRPKPTACGEWTGFVDIAGEVSTGQVTRVRVPVYVRVVPQHGSVLADHVPRSAPWPFHKRAACAELRGVKKEVELDPESQNNMKKRTPGQDYGYRCAATRQQSMAARKDNALAMSRLPPHGHFHGWALAPDPTFPAGDRRSLNWNAPVRAHESGRARTPRGVGPPKIGHAVRPASSGPASRRTVQYVANRRPNSARRAPSAA